MRHALYMWTRITAKKPRVSLSTIRNDIDHSRVSKEAFQDNLSALKKKNINIKPQTVNNVVVCVCGFILNITMLHG